MSTLTPTEQMHYEAIDKYIEVDNLIDPMNGPYSIANRGSLSFTARQCALITEREKLKFAIELLGEISWDMDSENKFATRIDVKISALQQKLKEIDK